VRFWKSRAIDGTIKNVTVSRTGKHWFVAFQVEMDIPDPVHPADAWIGIDLGVATFAACSDGTLIPPINALRTQESKLACAQQKLAQKVKFSQNWKKQQARIRHMHTRIAHCRYDFLHKHSTTISKNHAVVVVEDLQVRTMRSQPKAQWTNQASTSRPSQDSIRRSSIRSGVCFAVCWSTNKPGAVALWLPSTPAIPRSGVLHVVTSVPKTRYNRPCSPVRHVAIATMQISSPHAISSLSGWERG
jgi:putative transposase